MPDAQVTGSYSTWGDDQHCNSHEQSDHDDHTKNAVRNWFGGDAGYVFVLLEYVIPAGLSVVVVKQSHDDHTRFDRRDGSEIESCFARWSETRLFCANHLVQRWDGITLLELDLQINGKTLHKLPGRQRARLLGAQVRVGKAQHFPHFSAKHSWIFTEAQTASFEQLIVFCVDDDRLYLNTLVLFSKSSFTKEMWYNRNIKTITNCILKYLQVK